jgi:ribosomal protein S18 acetylase RimI-like enzyme
MALYTPDRKTWCPCGFAIFHTIRGVGKGVEVLHLARGYRTRSDLAVFIRQMDRENGGKIFSIEGFFGELGDRTAIEGLGSAGFIAIERVRMWVDPRRMRMVAPTPVGRYHLRTVNSRDRGALVRLFMDAYNDHVDSLFGLSRKGPGAAATEFIDYMFQTSKEERLLRYASLVLEDDAGRRLFGAVLVRRTPKFAYVADLMVDPHHQRQGIGTFLIVRALDELRRRRRRYVEIMVTIQNPMRSAQLYWRLGFRPVRGTSHRRIRFWVRRSRLVMRGVRFCEPTPSERRRFLVR